MKQLLKRVWLWLCWLSSVITTGHRYNKSTKALNGLPDDLTKTPKQSCSKKRKHTGKVVWDSRHGIYRRPKPKIGRNQPCPCGAIRQSPRDVSKREKFKRCCGKNG